MSCHPFEDPPRQAHSHRVFPYSLGGSGDSHEIPCGRGDVGVQATVGVAIGFALVGVKLILH
jgi:hypothetical protein